MQFFTYAAALACAATFSTAAPAPAPFSVEIDIHDTTPNAQTNIQHALHGHQSSSSSSMTTTLDGQSTLPYPFYVRDTKSGQFLFAPDVTRYAPLKLGDPSRFTLENGVLILQDRGQDGSQYQVGVSPILAYPPRSALLPIPLQGPGDQLDVGAVEVGSEGSPLRLLLSSSSARRYGTFAAISFGGLIVFLQPGDESALDLEVLPLPPSGQAAHEFL